MLTRCPYEILEVAKDATPDQIKTAYRRLAKRCHADLNESDPAYDAQGMIEGNEAYAILSDPTRRAKYDEYGSIATEAEEHKYATQCATTAFLDNVNRADPLQAARDGLDEAIRETGGKVSHLDAVIKRMLKTASKLSAKDGENLLGAAVMDATGPIRVDLQKERFKLNVQTRARKLLDNYDFLVDPAEKQKEARPTYTLRIGSFM